MWVIIPDSDDTKEPWVGQITRDETSKASWHFELVRTADHADLYRQEPFKEAYNVIGLLDHQKPCTLIRPIIEHVDPGRLDIKNKSQRTILKGVFQALLSDIPAEDGNEQKFLGVAFESMALDAWFGSPTFTRDFDRETRTPTLDIKPSQTEKFAVGGLGQVSITRAARLDPKLRSSALRSSTIFRVEFETAKSINEVMSLSFGLERLFGFLIGFRGQYPSFTTWIPDKIKSGDIEWNYDGTLQIGNVDWTEGELPHPLSCVHLKGISGGDLPRILEHYLVNEKDIVDRIHAVEFCRFFSRNINDRFSISMPVIDSYVQSRYKTGEEKSYIEAQADFFAWVDSSPSEGVREFPKKHISIKNSKSPGLKTLLLRAIDHVNEKGFRFDPDLAARIQDRRGKLFHAAPQMAEDDVLKFYIEVRAIAGLLLLHTIEDLGIDIAYLADRYHALDDLRPFMQPQKRAQDSAGQPESDAEHQDAGGQ